MWKKISIALYLISFLTVKAKAIDTLIIKNNNQLQVAGNFIYIKKLSNKQNFSKIDLNKNFKKSQNKFPNLGLSKSNFLISLTIKNENINPDLKIFFNEPLLDSIGLYQINDSIPILISRSGIREKSQINAAYSFGFLFDVRIQKNQTKTFIFKVRSSKQLHAPIFVGNANAIQNKISKENILLNIFLGIISAMFFYNLILYIIVKDNLYLYYIFYILIVGLTQLTINGFANKYLWGNNNWISQQSFFILTSLVNITGLAFVKVFLHTKNYTPRLNKFSTVIYAVYSIAILSSLFDYYYVSYLILQSFASVTSLYILILTISVYRKGYRPAKFFLIAWSFLISSIIIFVLSDLGIIPYNYFAQNSIVFGSSIEVILLSFALADKINTYKKEKEDSQQLALAMSQENERITREQNIILEEKVKQRTEELETANTNLSVALKDLKEAQSQLVDAEKMASLGQLTAGIAHEINNPINFVKSNIRPLQLDINDLLEVVRKYEELNNHHDGNIVEKLKEIQAFKDQIDLSYINDEINTLIQGIEDGATRTAEIVKGLRTFSRLDESELKPASIHEGIDSTLILLRNTLPDNITIEKEYGELPVVECYPGKLNQVFMNILNNAIHAIHAKKSSQQEKIIIKTYTAEDQQHVVIIFADSGTGMTPETKERIFEPFFTTKDVGEGTGLGLSIVFSIIEKHHGKIIVNSEYGKGSEFIITLPIVQSDTED